MPTPTDLKARYPEFDLVPNARIEVVIDETALDVTDDWPEDYREPARLALAAHLLATEGALSAGGGVAINGPVQSVKVGDVQTTFATQGGSSGGAAARYETTAYGKRFLQLRLLAFGYTSQVVRA